MQMNLDDYKSALQKRFEDEAQEDTLQEKDLQAYHRHRTPELVRRIRRNLITEMGVNILIMLIVGFAMLFTLSSVEERLIGGFLAILGLIFSLFTYREARLVGQLIEVEESVQASLRKTLQSLEAFLQRYKRLTVIASALGLIVGFWAGFQMGGKNKADMGSLALEGWLSNILLLIGFVVYIWIIWRFVQWYFHKLYGQHIAKLRENLELLTVELGEEVEKK